MTHHTCPSRHLAVVLYSVALTYASSAMATDSKAPVAPQENILTLGVVAGIGAGSSGTKQRQFMASPTLDYAMANGFFASTLRGIGYGNQAGGVQYSAALAYRGGRKEKDSHSFLGNSGSDRLRGMGDIKGSLILYLSASVQPIEWLTLSAATMTPITARETGTTFHLSADAAFFETATDTLSWNVTSSLADKKYMQTWYGVSAVQSAKSGFKEYKAKFGIYDIGTSLNWHHTFNQHWGVHTSVGMNRIVGDAAKSPLIKHKVNPTAGVQLTYQF